MDDVRLGQIWDACPIIDICALPAVCCRNCWKYRRIALLEKAAKNAKTKIRFPDSSKKEVAYEYDEYRPTDT